MLKVTNVMHMYKSVKQWHVPKLVNYSRKFEAHLGQFSPSYPRATICLFCSNFVCLSGPFWLIDFFSIFVVGAFPGL